LMRDRMAELAIGRLGGEWLVWHLRHWHGYRDRHAYHLRTRLGGILHLLGDLSSLLRLESRSLHSMLRLHVLRLLRVLLGLGSGVWHCPPYWHAVHRHRR
jgi:hypothetical protein